MAVAGIAPERCLEIGMVDQRASYGLPALAHRLKDLLKYFRPAIILTHAYEGGHPDHDATCFGVHAAAALLSDNGASPAPLIVEFATYHAERGGMAVGRFLPDFPERSVSNLDLSPAHRRKKEAMIACFVSQQRLLSSFPSEREVFRTAPEYDFQKPPHTGQLFYERFDWGITGQAWRERAGLAIEELGIR